MLDIDFAERIPSLSPMDHAGRTWGGAWVLLRMFGEPVGSMQIRFSGSDVDPEAVAAAVPEGAACAIRERIRDVEPLKREDSQTLPINGCEPITVPRYLDRRRAILEKGPEITAVICTRDQPKGLARCLDSLQSQSYPRTTLLVVDNASRDAATRAAVESSSGPLDVRYVHEARPGLSNARNRSLEAVTTDLIAWIDDDETADPDWLCELVGGFMREPQASAVCGVMVPGELDTQSQFWFEEYGGHSKGRGFAPAVFSPETRHLQSPLFPLPPFGTGGNMAMRAAALRNRGGFDRALGAGTRAKGAEDTRALTDILLDGGTVLYQPTAVTRHFHRRDYESFRRQLHGYGTALTAFYASLLWDRPSLLLPLLGLMPKALRELRDPEGPRLGGITATFPQEVLKDHRRGMLRGPFAYARERLLT